MKTWKWVASASAVALTAALTVPAQADVNIDDIVNDAATAGDVVSSGLGPAGQRYSKLTKINKGQCWLTCSCLGDVARW